MGATFVDGVPTPARPHFLLSPELGTHHHCLRKPVMPAWETVVFSENVALLSCSVTRDTARSCHHCSYNEVFTCMLLYMFFSDTTTNKNGLLN